MLHVQLVGTAWDVQYCEVWSGAEALPSHLGWSREQSGGPSLGSSMENMGMAQPCSLRGQSVLLWHTGSKQTAAAVLAGRIIHAVRGFFLTQVLLRAGGWVEVFQGLDSAPGLCSPHCFKQLPVSALRGRTCAGKLLCTTVLPTCPALQPGWVSSWIVTLCWMFHCPHALEKSGVCHGFLQAWVIKQANRIVKVFDINKANEQPCWSCPHACSQFYEAHFCSNFSRCSYRTLGKMSHKYLNTSSTLMNILHCRICEY